MRKNKSTITINNKLINKLIRIIPQIIERYIKKKKRFKNK